MASIKPDRPQIEQRKEEMLKTRMAIENQRMQMAILDRMPAAFVGSFAYFPGMGSPGMLSQWARSPPEVRCDYCRYRIPSDSIKCLNCGAPKP